jgi:hypothetical protein
MFHLLTVFVDDVIFTYLETSGVRKPGKGSARFENGAWFMTREVSEKYKSQIQRPLEH